MEIEVLTAASSTFVHHRIIIIQLVKALLLATHGIHECAVAIVMMSAANCH